MKMSRIVYNTLIIVALIIGVANAADDTFTAEITNAATSGMEMSATINPSSTITISSGNVALDIVPSIEGTFSSAHTTISTYTNTTDTCTVTMIASSTNLTTGANNIATLSSSSTEADFTNDRWGYRVGANGNYNPIEASNIITSYTQNTGTADPLSTDIYFATKLTPATKPGTYTNTVTFVSTCTPAPGIYIQDFTASQCEELASNDHYTVYDRRDGNDYTVRYIEGACWMTQNLRIVGVVNSEDSNFNTYSSVNVCERDLTTGTHFTQPKCHNSNNTTNGVWYNYAAASAKTITEYYNSGRATEDICPANWHLPSYTGTTGTVNSLTSTSTTSKFKFAPVAGGYYFENNSPDNTNNGYWWSTIASTSNWRYLLAYTDNNLISANIGRDYGIYIRCVRTD